MSETVKSRRFTAVIADDHGLTRDGIRSLLHATGMVDIVGEAGNGLETIAVIRRNRPNLAVIDLKMPHGNGAEIFIEVRRWSPETRVVLLTGLSTPALFRELVAAGIHGLFLKTGDPRQLSEALPKILSGQQILAEEVVSLIKASDAPSLTRRELQILQGVAGGETNAQIAARLGISPKTVDSHRTSLMAKLDVHSTAQLLNHALTHGLIASPEEL